MDLSLNNLPQSWKDGFGKFKDQVASLWNNVTTTIAKFGENVSNWLHSIGDGTLGRWYDQLGQWFVDDPGAATAGLVATGLAASVGVIVLSSGRVLGLVKNGIKALWKTAKGLLQRLNLGKLIRFGVGAVQYLWNFNWNMTDKQIRQQQKAAFDGLAGQWGEGLGSVAGTFACGWTLGRLGLANAPRLVRFSPDLVAKLTELKLDNFDENSELWEEAVGNLKAAIHSSVRVGVGIVALEGFLQIRKLIKFASRGLNVSAIAPGLASKIDKWGEEGSEPWSFAKAQEEFIEALPDGAIQNFAEEFAEAAQEACAESTINVSYAFGA